MEWPSWLRNSGNVKDYTASAQSVALTLAVIFGGIWTWRTLSQTKQAARVSFTPKAAKPA
jgi:hypothetical protein